jgi:excisionase family DNA binding protein
MATLLDHPRTLQPSLANQRGANCLARILEVAQVEPEAEPIRAELISLLHDMGTKGQGFAILTLDKELTPIQAAKLMGVSRMYFMRVIQQKAIPYRMVGTHYRVLLRDVLKLQEEDNRRNDALAELTAQAQEFDIGY